MSYVFRIRADSNLSRQIVSDTNAACNSYSIVTYFTYYIWTAVEEGDIASFVVQGLGLAQKGQ